MKALIVRLSSIGDVVHALPVLAALGREGWQVGWVVEPPARPLLEGGPVGVLVDAPPRRAFSLAKAGRALSALRSEDFDVALDMAGLWKSAAWARLSGARRALGFAGSGRREPSSSLLLHETTAPAAEEHIIDKNLALLRPLGIEAVGSREFPLPDVAEEDASIAAWLEGEGLAEFVLLNPGGGWTSKLWPAERFGELARALKARGLECVVSWGPGERHLADVVVSIADGAARPSPPTSLRDYLALARRSRLVVAADTGPLHIACAIGSPVVGLYGPTAPERNGPFSSEDRVVRRVPACAPCYSRSCPTHDGIMSELSVPDVLAAVEARLEVA